MGYIFVSNSILGSVTLRVRLTINVGVSEVTREVTGVSEVTREVTGVSVVTRDVTGVSEVTHKVTSVSEVTPELTGDMCDDNPGM